MTGKRDGNTACRHRARGLKKTAVLCGIIAFLLGIPVHTPAYVLQGAHVLDLMIRNLGRTARLSATHELLDPGISGDLQNMGAVETVKYMFPGRYRSRLVDGSGERVYLLNKGRSAVVENGVLSSAKPAAADTYPELFLYRSRTALVKRLAALGVDVSVSSLGRHDGRIAFVLGAGYPDETPPQLWVDKESKLPVRWIAADGTEARFAGWRKVGKARYPRRITLYEAGREVRILDVRDVRENVKFSGDLFDISRLEAEYPRATAKDVPGSGAIPARE